MKLTISIDVEVRDEDEGRRFFRVLKERFADSPDVQVFGSIISDANEIDPAVPG
ncbi:hypothetical protein LCGC14_1485580 [marine sediment metagenome]|uniref:Uncharacterized protein n=1 Tax=marine sediment metagenome TaxID=412755 RepID=A0A0F9JU49_9ZZZZ